jgi:hypothetical protein
VAGVPKRGVDCIASPPLAPSPLSACTVVTHTLECLRTFDLLPNSFRAFSHSARIPERERAERGPRVPKEQRFNRWLSSLLCPDIL